MKQNSRNIFSASVLKNNMYILNNNNNNNNKDLGHRISAVSSEAREGVFLF